MLFYYGRDLLQYLVGTVEMHSESLKFMNKRANNLYNLITRNTLCLKPQLNY